jgi:mannan endo-1,4-beta-mannosidase
MCQAAGDCVTNNCGSAMTCQPGGCYRCWKAQHRANNDSNPATWTASKQMTPYVRLVSAGSTEANLSELTVRYWFSQEGTTPQSVSCFYATINCTNVTQKIVALPAPRGTSRTTHYYEIGFKAEAGKLSPGGLVEVQAGIHQGDWTAYNETNDYSWRASDVGGTFVDSDLVTVYQNGYLVWGTEP